MAANNAVREQWLRDIDVNAITVGTLDSLAEQFLRDCRGPGEITPTTVEGFLAKGLMRRHGIFAHGRHNNPHLRNHVAGLTPGLVGPFPLSELLKFVLAFAGRVRHDGINVATYAAVGSGQQVLCDAVADYYTYLEQHYLADLPRLEQLLLDMMAAGRLAPITNNLRALLVDEFQDTNYQQEQIYLQLCQQSNASLTVVGDDDQSIFRFRGATVEIFANFQNRITAALGAAWTPNRVDLFRNYRSTQRIVSFCERFIQLDPSFQAARRLARSRSSHRQHTQWCRAATCRFSECSAPTARGWRMIWQTCSMMFSKELGIKCSVRASTTPSPGVTMATTETAFFYRTRCGNARQVAANAYPSTCTRRYRTREFACSIRAGEALVTSTTCSA